MSLTLPDPQLPGNPADALQSIQRNFEALAQTFAPPVPTGTVLPYAAATAPEGYLICDGGEVPVATYPRLDALLGTTYGARTDGSGGAGTSHFRLPDLRGRVVVSKGTHSTVNDLGESDTTAVNDRRPAHSHTGTAANATTGISIPSGGSHSHSYTDTVAQNGTENYTRQASGPAFNNNTTVTRTATGGSHSHTITEPNGGAGHGHSVSVGPSGHTADAPSFIVLNHIIKA